ncbi:MAG: hypothetical protein R2991_01915 [Thermoanaerobaculia bacterium]
MNHEGTSTRGPGRAVLALLLLLTLAAGAASAVGFTDSFRVRDCSWSSKGTANPYFSLRPGDQLILEGDDEGETVRNEITVLNRTERITFDVDGMPVTVRARVIRERETADGELTEISRNFFARCRQTSDIYYFGEDVDIYEDGQVVSHDGAWRAGEDGAMPGIVMPGTFLLGAKYYQEIAPESEALDRSQHVEMGIEMPTPAGTFSDCVGVVDTTPLDPESRDAKVYCPGVGLVMDEAIVLIEHNRVHP